MNITDALTKIIDGDDLSQQETKTVFDLIMGGEATPAQIGGVLMALRVKGECVDEIAGAAEAMREVSTKVSVDAPHLVDTCGTGGSGAHKLFNISTAAAFVVAAAGGHVAKHGNRGMTSKSGSADVLEAAGVNIEMSPEEIARCVTEVGVGFMFAQSHHPAMRHAGPVRRELGVRTLFNLIGPLTNPAGAKRQVIGVFDTQWQRPMAEVAALLGSEHVMVVHADGLDELTISGASSVVELRDGEITEYEVTPAQFDIEVQPVDGLHVDAPNESLALIESSLANDDKTGASDIVALNAGAAIYVAGIATSFVNGVAMAQDLIATGQAAERLGELIRFSTLLNEV